MSCVCGVPNKAAYYLHVIIGREGETDYSDIYLCRRHGGGIEDRDDVRATFRFDDSGSWEILEWELSDLGR